MFYKKIIITALISLMILSSFCSCGMKAYACEIVTNSSEINTTVIEGKTDNIIINEVPFRLEYKETYKSELTGKMIDKYNIVSDKLSVTDIHNVRIERESGNLIYFMGITPYDVIGNIENMSEYDLKKAVEKILCKDYDFSNYNDYSCNVDAIGCEYTLKWSVENQNISLTVYIKNDGSIYGISLTNAGSSSDKMLSISKEERNLMILNTLKKEKLIKTKNNINIDILSSKQSLYNGKDAIIYTVQTTDKGGFVSVHVVAIYCK